MAHEEQQSLIGMQKKQHTRKLRRLKYSCEEVYERMDNGLCIFCDELNTPGHHDLKHKGIQIFMVECDDDQVSDYEEEAHQVHETLTNPAPIEENVYSYQICDKKELVSIDLDQAKDRNKTVSEEKLNLSLGQNVEHLVGKISETVSTEFGSFVNLSSLDEYQKDSTVIESPNTDDPSFSHKDDRVWEPGGVPNKMNFWDWFEKELKPYGESHKVAAFLYSQMQVVKSNLAEFKTFDRKRSNKTLSLDDERDDEHEQNQVIKLVSSWTNRIWEPGGITLLSKMVCAFLLPFLTMNMDSRTICLTSRSIFVDDAANIALRRIVEDRFVPRMEEIYIESIKQNLEFAIDRGWIEFWINAHVFTLTNSGSKLSSSEYTKHTLILVYHLCSLLSSRLFVKTYAGCIVALLMVYDAERLIQLDAPPIFSDLLCVMNRIRVRLKMVLLVEFLWLIEHDKWKGSEKSYELSRVMSLMQGLSSTWWSYGKVAELTQELQQPKTYLKGIKLKELDRLAMRPCVAIKTWLELCSCWYKIDMLLLEYYGLEVQVLSCFKDECVIAKMNRRIVLCLQELKSIWWFGYNEGVGVTSTKHELSNWSAAKHAKRDIHESFGSKGLAYDGCVLLGMKFAGFERASKHISELNQNSWDMSIFGKSRTRLLCKMRIVHNLEDLRQFTRAGIDFHLKHKWRSKFGRSKLTRTWTRQTPSGLEVFVEDVVLFTSPDKLFVTKNHKLLYPEIRFCTHYNGLEQLSIEFQGSLVDETQEKRLLFLNNNNKVDHAVKENWFHNEPMIRGVFHLQRPPEVIDLQGEPNFITKVPAQWKEHPPDQFSQAFMGKYACFHP